jgi:glycosyltransferase involved in cell wall biosynthesis
MARFIGVKHNFISIVSDKQFSNPDLQILELPKELENVSAADLITDYKFVNGQIKKKRGIKPANEIKLALVGNWKMKCGIATYAENLWTEVSKHIHDIKLFIEEQDSYTESIYKIGDRILNEDQVAICWKRGNSTQALVEQLKSYDPDIIWIQHEFGLWPNASNWLSLMSQLSDYRVIVTEHSVFHHKDKTICEAAMQEIVTHLDGGRDVLKLEKEVPGNVYVIPHGCFLLNNEKYWNIYKSNKTFIQFGFGFRYKGWQNSIEAVAVLKKKYPDVFFTALFSESAYSKVEHQIYYNELILLIDKLDIKENVAIIRGYQSDITLNSYLRTNKVTVFPYVSNSDHEVFGVSGAARLAMSAGLPVITSSVNHFSDIPSIKADSPEEIAAALEKLFLDKEFRENQISKQIEYINEHTWSKMALKYISLFENG